MEVQEIFKDALVGSVVFYIIVTIVVDAIKYIKDKLW